MNNLKGYSSLADPLKSLFERTYQNHLKSMGLKEREKHTPVQLKEIKWNNRERCLKVYFKNGNWWNYSLNGTWH